jgi:hypothetical protein
LSEAAAVGANQAIQAFPRDPRALSSRELAIIRQAREFRIASPRSQ